MASVRKAAAAPPTATTLLSRVRNRTEAVRTNRTVGNKANLNQLAARIADLEALALAQGRLLGLIVDPTADDKAGTE